MTKSAGIARAISAASVSTRAAISTALKRTRTPSIRASQRAYDGKTADREAAFDPRVSIEILIDRRHLMA
jgi:hypothetical protein